MAGFASLKPAFTSKIYPASGFHIGHTSAGRSLQVVPIESGQFYSEPDYPVSVDAEYQFGSDYVRVDSSQEHVRIHVNSVLKNKDGTYFSYSYTGIVTVTPEFALILAGSKDAQTTSFGNALTQITFETGAEPLKDLENRIFVGSARFVVIESGYFIETKISQVVG